MKLLRFALFIASLAVNIVAIPARADLPYGPDTCIEGYVWREAVPGDHVCVIPQRREQAAEDNREASARVEPGGGPYGPDTCQQGWVWREAVADDHVCVTPQTRAEAADDNRQAASRRAKEPEPPPVRQPSPPEQHEYNAPVYQGQRLDWCLTWGANCGQPAALAFCHRRRYEDVLDFNAEVVGRSTPTRLIGSNQVCSGYDSCTAFASITCVGRISSNRVFANPTWKGYRLDLCLQWGVNCGQPAADAFCRYKGFSASLDSTADAESGYAATRLIGTGEICNESYCRGFQQIICR